MSVTTKKDGRVFCIHYQNGRQVWEPFGRGAEAKEAAEARDLEIKLKKKKGQWNTGLRSSSIIFQDLAQRYIDTRKSELSENTVDGILRAIATYALPVIGKRPITMITMNDWWRIQEQMVRRDISNKTVNTYFVYLSHIFTWAIEDNEDLLDEHPWKKRKRLKIRNKFRVDLFSLSEFRRIHNKAEPHCALAMEIAYYTGIRPGPDELFSLQWSNVDWKRKRIHIYSNKTDSWRWQYPDQEFMKRLKQQERAAKEKYPDCPWVISYQGKPIKSMKRAWKEAKTKAKITRRIRLYDIRHYYITYALASGADIMDLAERVGHVNGEMIMRVYAHLAKDLKRNKRLKIPSLYKN